MKANAPLAHQLLLKEILLVPGGEWTPRLSGWSFIHISRGVAYLMHARVHQEVVSGSTLVLSEKFRGLIRCSQLSDAVLHFFSVQPGKLNGILTLGEQKSLAEAAARETSAVRHFSPSEPLANTFRDLCEAPGDRPLLLRLQMLELFARALEPELSARTLEPLSDDGAKARLEALLKQMPTTDLLELSFGDLAAKVGCCPRHLGRLFQEVVGMSFRQKQTEARLARAQDLLITTNSKVLEVAMESGYQSLSLFNLLFKRRFGVTPVQWRQSPRQRLSTI